ncbi:MAG: ribonuclease J [Candidatus Dojkabacteria bacterium]|nr:ribonuclease J [Candidatus Dojkabacteria bacterium]
MKFERMNTTKRGKTPRQQLFFMPLGGVEDINRNCYVIEYGRDIVVLDMGLSFPDDDEYGVDYIVPDVEYLARRKERIKGIVLTHGHLDHVGAIPYVIEKLGFPTVYGREFTMLFLEERLKEHGLDKKVKRVIVEPKEEVQLGSLSFKLVPVTHAIPQSSSVRVKSPVGSIVYTGDYKFDVAPVSEPQSDYAELERIGDEGVSLLCMDSTNVYEAGKSPSETDIAGVLERMIKNAKGRVIAATFSSLGARIYTLIEIAKKHGRKVAITGRSMRSMLELLKKIGYVKVDETVLVPEEEIKNISDEKLLILTTGSQGEEMAGLSRMSRGEHRGVKIKDSDTVILSSSVIPGNQVPVQRLIDDLLKHGARVIHQSFMDVHTSGHGYQDDMKRMYELMRPRYIMPVHGFRSFIHEAAYLLTRWGAKRSQILLPETGQRFRFDPARGWEKDEKIPQRNIFVEGVLVGETDEQVITQRAQMSHDGVVFVWFDPDPQRTVRPIVSMYGVVGSAVQTSLVRDLESVIMRSIGAHQGHSVSDIRDHIYKAVTHAVEKITGKRPLVSVRVSGEAERQRSGGRKKGASSMKGSMQSRLYGRSTKKRRRR